MLEQRFRALGGLEARSSSDFERSVASTEKEACSLEQSFRALSRLQTFKKQARAVIWSAQRPKSKPEHGFRAPSGHAARSNSDFERSVEKAAPVRCFRVLSRQRKTYLLILCFIKSQYIYVYIYVYISTLYV